MYFVFDQPAYRVVFAIGALDRIADEVARLGAGARPGRIDASGTVRSPKMRRPVSG